VSTTKPDLQIDTSQAAKPNSSPCQCLWQRCNRSFTRIHPAQVFCDDKCRRLAVAFERTQKRRQARRAANRRYRSGEQGRAKHRESCRASRQRKKELAATAHAASHAGSVQPSLTAREGDTNLTKTGHRQKSSCHRPGCVADWIADPRIRHKKFCSFRCDNALRAAVTRVDRYYKSLGHVGAITSRNRLQVLLAVPGSRAQLRAFERVVLRC